MNGIPQCYNHPNMKRREVDLLNGPILSSLARLAGPIMATGIMNMAYNLTDMIWLGKLSANSVSAAGLAGMFLWLSSGFALVNQIGTQIMVGQLLGAGKEKEARDYASAGYRITLFEGMIFSLIGVLFTRQLIGFFRLQTPSMVEDARSYLFITSLFGIFQFWNMMSSGINTARGDSKTPFRINVCALVTNIILDPLLIFGFGPVKGMGVFGAALGTIIAQGLASFLHARNFFQVPFFMETKLLDRHPLQLYSTITRIGLPTGMESVSFSVISMFLSRQVTAFGDTAIAAQRIGVQIESVAWMMAEGFSSAGNAFTAQNYGAKQYDRVRKGMRTVESISMIWGAFCTLLLLTCSRMIFSWFIADPAVIAEGSNYLRIQSYSEIFCLIEMASAGVFNGLGRTLPPSLVGISFTASRIPIAAVLSGRIGVSGVWWACSLTAMIKGVVLTIWLLLVLPKILKKEDASV